MSNTDIVQAFIGRWNEKDYEGIMSMFTDDVCYHNIPMDALQGKEQVAGFLQGFVGMATAIDWQVHFIAEDADGNVLTERWEGGQWT